MNCPKNNNIEETERIFEAGEDCCKGCPEFTYSCGIGECAILKKGGKIE